MDFAGLVDYEGEIKKLDKSLSKTLPLVQMLEKKMSVPGYAEKGCQRMSRKIMQKS